MSPNPQELKGLIDSTPDKSVLLNLAGFYAKRQLPEKGVDSEVVYDCPRTQVMIRTAVTGTQIGAHFHTVSDEVVIIVGGRGEMLDQRRVAAGETGRRPRLPARHRSRHPGPGGEFAVHLDLHPAPAAGHRHQLGQVNHFFADAHDFAGA